MYEFFRFCVLIPQSDAAVSSALICFYKLIQVEQPTAIACIKPA